MTIKEAREFAGMTQQEVEDEFGVPVRSLQNWESGTRQPPEYVEAYLVEKLTQRKKVARVRVVYESLEVVVETMSNSGWDLSMKAPIQDKFIPVSILISIGQLHQSGYKLVFM